MVLLSTFVQAQIFNCAGSCRCRLIKICGIAVNNCAGKIFQLRRLMSFSVSSNLWYCCLQLCRHNFLIVLVHVDVSSLGFVVMLSQLCGHNFSIVQVHVDVGSLGFLEMLSQLCGHNFSIVQIHVDVASLGFVVLLSTIVLARFFNCAGS